MPELTKKQKRTAIIIATLLILAFGTAGWLVWRVVHGSVYGTVDQFGNARIKTYTDTAKFYSIEYPITFIVTQESDCCEGVPKDWSVVSRTVNFRAPNYPEQSLMTVLADATPVLAKQIRSNWADNDHTPTDLTVNGRSAQYVRVEFNGDAESYVDHNYLITNAADGSVFVNFRERYQHYESGWDASWNVPAFQAMVQSIRLL